jgi:hypothetical protein
MIKVIFAAPNINGIMNLQQRIKLLVELGDYILSEDPLWQSAKVKAAAENSWFTPDFIEKAVANILNEFLKKDKLEAWANRYGLPDQNLHPKNIGIVMAGNIPLVGFHDFLSVFITGHRQTVKPSSKDDTLIRHLAQQLNSSGYLPPDHISFSGMLKGCDGYIATGSNNSAGYFEYYFGRYPHLIRRNRTSIAILDGYETGKDLEKLADDVYLYFGLGCRNVTKILVPEGYDFQAMLESFGKYDFLANHNKYINNYDYQLAVMVLNKKYYMSNKSILLTEDRSAFSPISVLHYEFYRNRDTVLQGLEEGKDIQCIVGNQHIPFGQAQYPSLTDYADGVDTVEFLTKL